MDLFYILINIITIPILFAYNLTAFQYARKLVPFRLESRWYTVSVSGVNTVFLLFSINQTTYLPLSFLIQLLILLIEFKIFFRTDSITVLFGASNFVFHMTCLIGVVISSWALFLEKSLSEIIDDPILFRTAVLISFTLAFAVLYVFRKNISDTKIRLLLRQTRNLRFAATSVIIMTIFTMFSARGYYLKTFQEHIQWYSFFQLISLIMVMTAYYIILTYAIQVSELIEYEVTSFQVQEQLSRQISHYNSYKKYTDSLRIFKHDYKDMMVSVKQYLQSGQLERAVTLIDQINDKMHYQVQMHKSYSSNVIVDAILQDAANFCAVNSIQFDAMVHIPSNADLSDLDLCRIFSNISNNAMEACKTVLPDQHPFIEYQSTWIDNWLSIQIRNSYNGILSKMGDEYLTTKRNSDLHGLGLKSIRGIVEQLGGMMRIETTPSVFVVNLHFYITPEEPSSNS